MTAENRADRRDAIVRAAFSCMARQGYERTTTAQICTAAGVSSGTFIHYFPTKAEVLVAVLEGAFERTQEVFERIRRTAVQDAAAAVEQWRDHVLDEAADEDLASFVAVLGGVPQHSGVAAVLQAERTLVRDVLIEVAANGQRQGTVRNDLAPDRIATWLAILTDGVLSHAVEEGPASLEQLRPEMAAVITRLLE
ncbi:MAG: TetR/AcrR family transcriptional regulator [Propionibacteriaceae bacterium]|nr:TetR/AcrR family transcriptional regulator [Propionibacteriaceae bacterium]